MTKTDKTYHASNESWWRYDGMLYNGVPLPAPKGEKVALLTKGGQQVIGVWQDNGGFLAWAPLIKRDKQVEELLGIR